MSDHGSDKTTAKPIFTVYEGNCYWSMPDGSNRCITGDDAKRINDALGTTNRHAFDAGFNAGRSGGVCEWAYADWINNAR